MFADAAFVAAQVGESDKALALATEGRARMLAMTLKLQTLALPADKRWRLDELRAEIRSADRDVEAAQEAGRAAAVERLAGLRQELLELVKEADAAEAAPRGSALAQATALAGKGGAVAVPIVTRFGAKILIVTSGSASGSSGAGLTAGRKRKAVAAKDARSGGGAADPDPRGPNVVDLPGLTTDKLDGLMRRRQDQRLVWRLQYQLSTGRRA